MKSTVIKFGLISGGVLGAMMAITMPLCLNGTLDFDNSEVFGYTTMVLAFLAVFFGVRTYRDADGGGSITFGRAFKVGILISLVSCALYVVSWEIIYWGFLPDFGDKYAAHVLEKRAKSGASPEVLAAEKKKMQEFKELYRNPLFNVGITFMEVFPVGLIAALVSAGILRRKAPPAAPAGAVATA